jgi:diketogulonate reductase-like aldo/keto reductase
MQQSLRTKRLKNCLRIAENFDIFDFELTADEMAA